MLRNLLLIVFAGCLLWTAPLSAVAQESAPARKPKRTTGVKIVLNSTGGKNNKIFNSGREAERIEAERIEAERLASERLASDNARLESERLAQAAQFAEARRTAAAEKQGLLDDAVRAEQQRLAELAAKELEIAASRAETERITSENADLQKAADEARRAAEEKEKERLAADAARLEAAQIRAEKERREAETRALEKAEIEVNRRTLVEMTAQRLGFLKPLEAVSLVPAGILAAAAIEAALKAEIIKNPRLIKEITFCDPDFVAPPFNLELTADDTFGTLLEDLRLTFGINFLPDAEVIDLPVRVNVQNVPWNYVLRSQLTYLDLDARCFGNTVSLFKRTKMLTLQDSQRKTAPTRTEYIKLQYLRPTSGGQSNLAGKSTGAATLESLEQAVQKILQTGGDNRGVISRIPGRAEFFITATDEQLTQIRQVIAKADRPTYRVDVYGLVYTINENKLKDIGSQLSAVINTGNRVSGVTTLPVAAQAGGSQSGAFINNPFAQPGGLQAGSPNTILAARASLGLFDFNYQLSLLESLGIARRVEKPFISVKDGSTGTFENGTQIPVVIQAVNNLGGGGGSIEFINAGTTLSVTPQVVGGEDGAPLLVNLTLRLESNTPNLSIQTTGSVPSVNSRRIQNEITLAPGQAFISGGSNDSNDSNTVSRTPGAGSIPLLGNLFRRKSKSQTDNKLYFAVWVQISLDDGSSPIPTGTLNTTFPVPPPMDAPLALPGKKP